jgi:membrane associated rhomboid family serine protease
MFPLTDGMPPRRFPAVNVAIIAACFAVWIFYELPNLNSAVHDASLYTCDVTSCNAYLPWEVSWFTAMFMHASWSHISATCGSSSSSART